MPKPRDTSLILQYAEGRGDSLAIYISLVLFVYAFQIIDICLEYLTYDPNYNYDEDDEEAMEMEDEDEEG